MENKLPTRERERIAEALCAAAVNMADISHAPTRLEQMRKALVTECEAVYGLTPVASPSKKRARR